jgi:hypothetical protein
VVTVDLAAVNDPPQAADDTVAGVEDQSLTIAAASLLANDTDVEGRALAIIGVADVVGVHGVADAQRRRAVHSLTTDFAGAAGFTYWSRTGNGGTRAGFVTVKRGGRERWARWLGMTA